MTVAIAGTTSHNQSLASGGRQQVEGEGEDIFIITLVIITL